MAFKIRAIRGGGVPAHQDPIVRARPTSSLGMTERGDPRVEVQLLREDILDVTGGDGIQVLVNSPLCDDDDALSLAELAVLLEDVAHLAFPVVDLRRLLGNEDVICAGSISSVEFKTSQLAYEIEHKVSCRRTHDIAAMTASQPQCLPMTSMTKALE